jgi:hypothetical protein
LHPNDVTTFSNHKISLSLSSSISNDCIVATLDNHPSKKGDMDSLSLGCCFIAGNGNGQMSFQLFFSLVIW